MAKKENKNAFLRKFMVFLVLISFGVALFVLVYALSKGSTTVVQKLSVATEENDPIENNFYNGQFRMREIKYFERGLTHLNGSHNTSDMNKTFCNRTKEYMILELVLNNKKMPLKCEVFVDQKMEKEIKTRELYELEDEKNESIMPLNLGMQTVHDTHMVKVCCDKFCQKKEIKEPCKE